MTHDWASALVSRYISTGDGYPTAEAAFGLMDRKRKFVIIAGYRPGDRELEFAHAVEIQILEWWPSEVAQPNGVIAFWEWTVPRGR
jgi:hypothetical protein